MALPDAQRFFDQDDTVSAIELRVGDVYGSRETARAVERALGGFPYRARDWMEVNRNLFSALKLEKVVYGIVLALIVVVAAFNILASLTMVVKEKRRDIAVLKSMGASNAAIGRIFILNGAVIGVAGTILGEHPRARRMLAPRALPVRRPSEGRLPGPPPSVRIDPSTSPSSPWSRSASASSRHFRRPGGPRAWSPSR
jgi:hypothetical protein